MENTKNIIELKHITKTYEDGFTAVSDFNLEVKQGEGLFIPRKKYSD